MFNQGLRSFALNLEKNLFCLKITLVTPKQFVHFEKNSKITFKIEEIIFVVNL